MDQFCFVFNFSQQTYQGVAKLFHLNCTVGCILPIVYNLTTATTIKLQNITITPKRFFIPLCRPHVPEPLVPGNHWQICFCIIFFSQYKDFEIHSYCCIYHQFITFYFYIVFLCKGKSHFVFSFTNWRTFRLSCLSLI